MIWYNSLLECSVSIQNNISQYSVSTDWAKPQEGLNLGLLLGITGHFFNIVKNYAKLEQPLHNLLHSVNLLPNYFKTHITESWKPTNLNWHGTRNMTWLLPSGPSFTFSHTYFPSDSLLSWLCMLRLTQHTDLFLFFHTLTPLHSHTCSTMTHISRAHDS